MIFLIKNLKNKLLIHNFNKIGLITKKLIKVSTKVNLDKNFKIMKRVKI